MPNRVQRRPEFLWSKKPSLQLTLRVTDMKYVQQNLKITNAEGAGSVSDKAVATVCERIFGNKHNTALSEDEQHARVENFVKAVHETKPTWTLCTGSNWLKVEAPLCNKATSAGLMAQCIAQLDLMKCQNSTNTVLKSIGTSKLGRRCISNYAAAAKSQQELSLRGQKLK